MQNGGREAAVLFLGIWLLTVPVEILCRRCRQTCYLAASRAPPNVMNTHLAEADFLRQSGKYAEAEAAYHAAISRGAPPGEAYYGLGMVQQAAQRPREALMAFQQAVRDPAAPMEAFVEGGKISASAGRPDLALRWIEQATVRFPDRYEPPYFLGCMLANGGRDSDAIEWLQRAHRADPQNAEVLPALIQSLRRLRRLDEALGVAAQWVALNPSEPAAHAALSHVAMERSQLDIAIEHAQQAESLAPDNPDTALLKGRILVLLDRHKEAKAALGRARTLAPQRPDIYVHLGNVLKILGDPVEARATLRQALLLAPNNVEALFELTEITRFSLGDPTITTLEGLAATGHAPSKVHFALGKAYDDLNRSAEAFKQFERANAEEKARRPYDETATLAVLKRLAEIFSSDFVASVREGFATDLPVFIVGMPRSGSTLLEQILSSHPDIAAAGEQLHLRHAMDSVLAGMTSQVAFPDSLAHLKPEDFRTIGARYIGAIGSVGNGRRRISDKLLSNGLLAGLIHMALPGAKIIHCLRDPLDTCLSCYMKSFGPRVPFSTDLANLGRYYRAQEVLMDHWRAILPPESFMQVRYEDVVADIEKESRRLISFVGLDWNDACLDFHRNERAVNTASVAQVREPLYDSSVGRWRRYAIQLQPLSMALKETPA